MRYHERRENKARIKEARAVTFSRSYDVIVAGMGSGGIFCALAAAAEGCSVLGLERAESVGGMTVRGNVNGYYYGNVGGLYEEVDRESNAMTGTVFPPFGSFHPDARALAVNRRLAEAGVSVACDSVVLGIYEEEDRVLGIRAFAGGEIADLGCKVLVDGTSEGHLMRLYGVPGRFGRGSDGGSQPFTSVRVFRTAAGKISRTNFDSGYASQYDNRGLTRAILKAHSRHVEILGSEERFLYCAPQIGVREGFLFEGEETLTLGDILDQRQFDDVLLYGYCDIDKHGRDLAFDESPYQDWFMLSNLSTVTARIPIPLGCLIPRGVRGLASASRCLSLDSYASSAVRMNREMHRLGEACGVAAAMAARDGDLRLVDRKRLREKLSARRCFDGFPHRALGFNFPGDLDNYTPVTWLDTAEGFRAVLDSDQPGVAIWSARRLGRERAVELLLPFLRAESTNLRMHAALALGLAGSTAALPVLREIVGNRSAFFLKDCRRSNQLRSAIAILLCGRLGDAEILEELLAMLRPEEFDRPLYHTCTEPSYQFGIVRDLNTVYYQHLSAAVAALVAIAKSHPPLGERVFGEIQEHLGDLGYISLLTVDGPETSNYLACLKILRYAEEHLQ